MARSPSAFEAISLSKSFRRWLAGTVVNALADVSFSVQPGTIFGLLGPNGAGKTTLLKLALTIAHPDKGEVRIFGQTVRNRSILSRTGYLPENPRFPSHLTARQVLRLYGSLSGASADLVDRNSAKWLERLDLSRWADTRVSKFSKGMNERLALAQALVHEPDLIFLDEPTDGLDPLGRMEVRSICRELADAGKTIFINSHILAEIELICDCVGVMKGGRIVEMGTVARVTAGLGGYDLFVPATDALGSWLSSMSIPFTTVDGRFQIHTPDRTAANGLLDVLRKKNIEIESLSVNKRTLESVFFDRIS
jgi:ABC-2 type transport system ATP-binding protein